MLQGIEYAKQQAECWKQERERNYRTADLFQEDIDAIGEPVPRGLIRDNCTPLLTDNKR